MADAEQTRGEKPEDIDLFPYGRASKKEENCIYPPSARSPLNNLVIRKFENDSGRMTASGLRHGMDFSRNSQR